MSTFKVGDSKSSNPSPCKYCRRHKCYNRALQIGKCERGDFRFQDVESYALTRVRAFAEGLKDGTFNNLELIGHSEFCLGANDAIVRFKNYIDRALAEMEGK